VAAVLGVTAGFGLFFVLRIPVAAIPFTGAPFFPRDLSLSLPGILAVALGVPAAAAPRKPARNSGTPPRPSRPSPGNPGSSYSRPAPDKQRASQDAARKEEPPAIRERGPCNRAPPATARGPQPCPPVIRKQTPGQTQNTNTVKPQTITNT
jgi:hypothetical protein